MKKGYLITFEGIDGSGKSLQAVRLFNHLKDTGMDGILLREPGSSSISEKIRAILLDASHSEMTPTAELLLYEAARAQLVEEVILPAIHSGKVVICDRFYDSTTAYQGYGRQFDLSAIQLANQLGSRGLAPDRTYILDVSLKEAANRLNRLNSDRDRMESQDLLFFERVREGYRKIVEASPDRVRLLDGHRTIESLEQEILADVQLLLV